MPNEQIYGAQNKSPYMNSSKLSCAYLDGQVFDTSNLYDM